MILMTTIIMISYRTIIYRVSLNNETAYLKRFLEYAQEYSLTYQVETSWQKIDKLYIVKKATGEILKKHHIPNIVNINQSLIEFQSRLTPSKGVTVIVSVGKRQKSVIIDPSTGRVRVSN